MKVKRLANNPIISPNRMNGVPGDNINGPSLIRVPDWAPNRMGKYYLYFAHHQGTSIRLAYADELGGPWTVYTPGALQLEQTVCRKHIASPDVFVNDDQRRFRMYFHGPAMEKGQHSLIAYSTDGIHFVAEQQSLGPPYFRVFEHDGASYAVARGGETGLLLRSPDGVAPFEVGPGIMPRMRHAAVRKTARDEVEVFYSRIGDNPEHIVMSLMKLDGDWRQWRGSDAVSILLPEERWEGADEPAVPSKGGLSRVRVRQLRDPGLFEEDGRWYLLYSVAGEQGIAIAEIEA